MAVGGLDLRGIVSATGFRIEQNCRNYSLQIAANPASVVIEHLRHPGHVVPAGVAAHQLLYQLLCNERAYVGMVKNIL